MSEFSDALARVIREHAPVLARLRDGRPRCFMEELQPHTCQRVATRAPDGSGEPYLCESCAKDVAA